MSETTWTGEAVECEDVRQFVRNFNWDDYQPLIENVASAADSICDEIEAGLREACTECPDEAPEGDVCEECTLADEARDILYEELVDSAERENARRETESS